MAGKSHTTFKKRQKEMARVEKQLEKAAKRQRRKEGEPVPDASEEQNVTVEEAANPPS